MSFLLGVPTKDLKDFYKEFIKETIKTKSQVVDVLNYFSSEKFIIDIEENLGTETNIERNGKERKFKGVSLIKLKDFYNTNFKLTAAKTTKGRITNIIKYIVSEEYQSDLDKLEGKQEQNLQEFKQEKRKPKEPKPQQPQKLKKPKSTKPPSELPPEFKEIIKFDREEKPDGANEVVEGLTNFYLSQQFKDKASFLVQRDIQNLRFEDIELVVNIDRKNGEIFVDEDNQDLIFGFIKRARKDVIVIFLGIADWVDFDKEDINASHSNLLIYRRDKKWLERFEPDSTPLELDRDIDDAIQEVFKQNGVEVKRYISPTSLCIRLQGLEEAEKRKELLMRKLPPQSAKSVSCFFWNVVYLRARLNDLSSTQEQVVEDLLEEIQMKSGSLSIFIKNYSISLINLLRDFGVKNKVKGIVRRNTFFLPTDNDLELRRNQENEEVEEKKFIESDLKKMRITELKRIAIDLGITIAELKKKKKKQVITMILDRQSGFIRDEEDLDDEIDEEGAKMSLGKLIEDVLSGKVNPRKDKEKLQKQFDKLDKKEGEKTFAQELARIQTRIDIAFINVIGLENVEVDGKKLGNPKDHGQPPFTKTEKTVISIAKKLNPFGVLSETDVINKAFNFIKAFFGGASRSSRNRRNIENRNVLVRTNLNTDLDIVKSELEGNLLKIFEEQDQETQQEILDDVRDLIKEQTDFKTISETPSKLRKRLIQQSIGFIVFNQ